MLHRVVYLLVPKDVASARLTCSLLAAVGAEHLTREVRLLYEKESFESLNAISAHPVSKNVTSLFFQGDRVKDYPTRESWASSDEITYDEMLDDFGGDIVDAMSPTEASWAVARQLYREN